MPGDKPIGERVAVTENDIKTLYIRMTGLEEKIEGLTKGAWGVVIALLAWALVQIYSGVAGQAVHAVLK